MTRNLTYNFNRKTFFLLFAAFLCFGFLNNTKAAGAFSWTKLPVSQVNDVAVDSTGAFYITKIDGTIQYSVNGTFYISIPLPPPLFYNEGGLSISTNYKANRIAVAPDNIPWAVFTKTVKTTDRSIGTVNITVTQHLYQRPNALGWVERVNSPNPADVAVAADGTIFVTSATAPYNLYSTNNPNGAFSFVKIANSDNSSRISAGYNKILWVVKINGELMTYESSGNKWKQTTLLGMNDVGASHPSKVVGLTENKLSILGKIIYDGSIWTSVDFGITFTKEPQKKNFQNIAVSSENTIYAADLFGFLWSSQ